MTQSEKYQHWHIIIEQQKQSSLTIKEFCEQRNVAYQTFYYWSKKLNDSAQPQKAQPIVIDDVSHQVVTLTLTNGLRVELPCFLSKLQIQTWLEAIR